MGLAQYQILPQEDEWGVLHDGDVKNTYATKKPPSRPQRRPHPLLSERGMKCT